MAMGGSSICKFVVVTMTLALISARLWRVVDAQDTTVLKNTLVCNGAVVSNVFQQYAIIQALGDVVTKTSDPGYYRKTSKVENGERAWAIGACFGKLSKKQCNNCMADAGALLRKTCVLNRPVNSYARGARVKLQDCRVRWELYDFAW